MPKNIKTRTTVKDIKILDKSANLSEHMKDTFVRTKDRAEETQSPRDATPTEYASGNIQTTARGAAVDAAHRLPNTPHKVSENINRAKEHFQEVRSNTPKERSRAAADAQKAAEKAKSNAENLRKTADKAGETARDANAAVRDAKQMFVETRQKAMLVGRRGGVSQPSYMNKGVTARGSAVDAAKALQAPAKSTGRAALSAKTAKGTSKDAVKTAKKSVKSAKSTVKTAKKAAATAQIKAKAAAKAAKTAERTARTSAKTAAKTAKTAAKGVAAMAKAAIAAAKGVAAAVAAGGSVAVTAVIVIGLVGLLLGSAYGIFFSGDADAEDTMPLSVVQGQIQAQYNARIAATQNSVSHDAVIMHGEMPDFIEVVAVFAVLTTTREDGLAADVVTIDEDRAQRLLGVFWDMCEISYEIVTHVSESVNDAGETVTVESRVLHIYTTSKTYEDMPDIYGFSSKQTELLYEIMEMRDLLAEVIGMSGWYTGGAANINMTDEELYALAAYYGVTLPENLSIERKNVLAAAFAGVQINIPYHYDWRSYYKLYPGIEGNDFGSATTPDYKGRSRKGTDCSGFVGWAYYSGGITWSGFGYGESGGAYAFYATPSMRSVSSTTQIAAENLKPGDIGFISNSAAGTSDHTGIFLGTTASGIRMWLHCAGSTGAVCTGQNFGVFYTVAGMDATFGERKTGGEITGSDTQLLAQLIYYEGRGYSSYCMELIAQVAVNRVKSSKFPDTLTEVLQQPGQYGYGRPGMTATLIFSADITQHSGYTDEIWQKCLTAAQRVVNGMSRDENGGKWPENVLYQHSFSDKNALGVWYKSYTDASGIFTEHFCFG